MVYEGCQRLLEDGRVCALGVVARKARQAGAYKSGTHSRGHREHIRQEIGEGSHMLNFFIRTAVGRCQVWEEAGLQLFGISGEEFWRSYRTRAKMQTVCQSVMSQRWNLPMQAINDQKAEWWLVSVDPVFVNEGASSNPGPAGIGEVLEAMDKIMVIKLGGETDCSCKLLQHAITTRRLDGYKDSQLGKLDARDQKSFQFLLHRIAEFRSEKGM